MDLDTARTIITGARAQAASAGFKPLTVVVLDPGHGGADRGASGHGLVEAAVVEDLDSSNGTFVNGNELHAPATVGPGPSIDPPFASTPLTVMNRFVVWNSQITAPSVVGIDQQVGKGR